MTEESSGATVTEESTEAPTTEESSGALTTEESSEATTTTEEPAETPTTEELTTGKTKLKKLLYSEKLTQYLPATHLISSAALVLVDCDYTRSSSILVILTHTDYVYHQHWV